MLWVAFSRRMCCSRVWRASTKPRRPSASTVSPAIRPGIRRRCSSVAQKKPNEGPPKSSLPPSGWPSPTAIWAPHSPGGRSTPRVSASTAATVSAPASRRGRGEGLEILHRAEEVRVLDEQGGGVAVQRRLELGGVGEPALEAHLDHLGAEAARVGDQRLAAVGMKAPRDDQAPAPGGADRQVGGGGHRRRPLVQRGVGHRQRAELRDRGLELEHHLEAALRDLGLVGRVGGEELRALGDRVDDRRHVVVVHPGPEEAELGVGVGVALGQRGQVVEALGLRQPGRQVEGAIQPQLGGNLGEQLVDRARRRSHRASPGGRNRWLRCSGSSRASLLPGC